MSPTQRKLLLLLSVATFFEGFDFLALSQILPSLSAEFDLDPGAAGAVIALCNVGTLLSWGLVRWADRIGRRPVLALTIAGYTLATLGSGLAATLAGFVVAQLLARMFLLAEWGLSMVYAAEEFPAEKRGLAIGVVQTASTVGSITCAMAVPPLTAAFGWRAVFFVGVLPLALLAFARRSLPETRRYRALTGGAPVGWLAPWRTAHAPRIVQLGLIWAGTYACTQTSIAFWKEFAVGEGGLTDAQVGTALAVASLGALPLIALVGTAIDRLGRRRAAVGVYALTIAGVLASYNLHGPLPLTAGLVLGVFGSTAVLPLLNAWSTELFPTEIRATAYGWANYLIGRTSYVLAPLVVGQLANAWGWGSAVSLTVLGPALSLLWILRWMPETVGLELEQTSRAIDGPRR